MSLRVICKYKQWHRLNYISQQFNCLRYSHHYAMLTGNEEMGLMNRTRLEAPMVLRFLESYVRKVGNVPSPSPTAAASDKSSRSPSKEQNRAMTVEQLIARLEHSYELNGYLNAEHFEQLLRALEEKPNEFNQLLQADQLRFLLSASGTLMPSRPPTVRYKNFQRLWQYLSQHKQLTKEDYLTHLLVLQHNRLPLANMEGFIEEYGQLGGDVNSADFYADLLAVACCSGSKLQTTNVLSEMRAKNMAITIKEFNSLILGHSRSKDLSGCLTVLESISAAGLSANTDTWANMVIAYLENNEQAKAKELLFKQRGKFMTAQLLDILQCVLHADMDDKLIKHIIKEFPLGFTNVLDVPRPIRTVLVELLHKQNFSGVSTILNALPMPESIANDSIDTYGVFLLQELVLNQVEPARVLEICRLLKVSGKNIRSLHRCTEIAIRRNPRSGIPYLEALALEESLRPHYFWPLLMYNFKRHGESGIFHSLKMMNQFNVPCDQETLDNYVFPRIGLTLEDPLQTLKILEESGLKISQIMTPLLGHLLSQQNMGDTINITKLYTTKVDVKQLLMPLVQLAVNVRATKRYPAFAKTVMALVQRKNDSKFDFVGKLLMEMLSNNFRLREDADALYSFVYEMNKCGLPISTMALDRIQAFFPAEQANTDKFQKILGMLKKMAKSALSIDGENGVDNRTLNSSAISSFTKHPRDMTIDELECHLVELESKGLNARGVLRRLLQLCVRDNRLSRALEIKAKCDALNVQVSPGMLASIFDLYIKLGDLPNAQKSLENLKQSYPGFQIDEHKIIDYAALLVYKCQMDEGKQLLEERAAKQKVIGGDYVIKNVWKFLTNVAHLAATQDQQLAEDKNLTKETFAFLNKLGYCNAHNAVLGPIVREYLLRGNIQAAVREFGQLAKQYKHTPLQFELLSLLVRLCNGHEQEVKRFSNISSDEAQRLLKEVSETISKCHGPENMNSALLLAIAESGSDKQLRRLLMNPEFRINQELLVKNCEHLGQEGSVQTLLRLARGARGLSRVVDEQTIYDMLLKNFITTNNCAGALNLYECLEADDELKISQDFLRSLVRLLKVNNVQVPSNIALRAQVV